MYTEFCTYACFFSTSVSLFSFSLPLFQRAKFCTEVSAMCMYTERKRFTKVSEFSVFVHESKLID